MIANKKRILYLETGTPLLGGHEGGSMYSLLELLRLINKNKYELFIVLYYDFPIVKDYKNLGANVIIRKQQLKKSANLSLINKLFYRTRKICFDFQEFLWLLFFIKKNKISIFHGNDRYTANWIGVGAAVLCKKKIIVHQRQFETSLTKLQSLLISKVDYFFAISEAIKENILKFTQDNTKAVLVHNWVNFNDIKKTDLINRFVNIKTRKLSILWIGRLTEWKGFHKLIEIATYFISSGYKEFKIDYYGEFSDEKYKEKIFYLIKENNLDDFIFFKGYIKFSQIDHSQYDVLFHTSIKPEPFGRTIIEAMSKHIIVCASHLGGVKDIIKNENGYLIDYNNYENVLRIAKYIHNNPEEDFNMIKSATSYLKENFAGIKQIKIIESIYDEI